MEMSHNSHTHQTYAVQEALVLMHKYACDVSCHPEEVFATAVRPMGFMRIHVLSTQRTSGNNMAHRVRLYKKSFSFP